MDTEKHGHRILYCGSFVIVQGVLYIDSTRTRQPIENSVIGDKQQKNTENTLKNSVITALINNGETTGTPDKQVDNRRDVGYLLCF